VTFGAWHLKGEKCTNFASHYDTGAPVIFLTVLSKKELKTAKKVLLSNVVSTQRDQHTYHFLYDFF
jgi:hypothetical protein